MSWPCTLHRLRVVLLGSSTKPEFSWNATLCRGVHVDPQGKGIRYDFVDALRNDQMNASRIDTPGDPFGGAPLSEYETPTITRGEYNNVPLVMTCESRTRWKQRIRLLTLSPWYRERMVWESCRADRQPCPSIDAFLLPVDLEADIDGQLGYLKELQTLLSSLPTRRRKAAASAPLAIAVMGSDERERPVNRTSFSGFFVGVPGGGGRRYASGAGGGW